LPWAAATPSEASSFAEDPARAAHEARIFFAPSIDPYVLACDIGSAPASVDLLRVGSFSAVLRGDEPGEQVLLTDGLHNLRLEVHGGSLVNGPVSLRVRFEGVVGIDAPLLTLRRLVAFHRLGRMPLKLFPPEAHVTRSITLVRAWDAHIAGATQREIAELLLGASRARADWSGSSDYLRSKVKRLLRTGRAMVHGDWRKLLRPPLG